MSQEGRPVEEYDPRPEDQRREGGEPSVEERTTTPPEATTTRGTGFGSGTAIVLIIALVSAVVIILILSGAWDLGGDAPQADDVSQPSPQLETPGFP